MAESVTVVIPCCGVRVRVSKIGESIYKCKKCGKHWRILMSGDDNGITSISVTETDQNRRVYLVD